MASLTLPIDPFQITQEFGVNPQTYAQFGLKGHNGWDIRTKYLDTPEGRRSIKAPQDSQFYRKGTDPNGYGEFLEIKTSTSTSIFKHTFGHCFSVETFTSKKQSEDVAISDNTGFSTAAHLHWTVKKLDTNGNIIDYNNGYFGAINPQIYIDEVRADITSSQPNMDTKKAVQFDQVLDYLRTQGYIQDSDSNHYLDGQFLALIKKLYEDMVSQRGRAGKWDGIVNKQYGAVNSNPITVDQLFNDIKASGFDKQDFINKVVAYINTL